jgi:hypothetical protein
MYCIEEARGNTMIEVMRDARVFGITKEGENFRFVEWCDEYFSITLDKEQMITLANELLIMASGKES